MYLRIGPLALSRHRRGSATDPYGARVLREPAGIALDWLLHNDAVTAPMIGRRTVEQLTGSLPALNIALSGETLRQLDGIWPGPGGEAPIAYTW